MSEWMNLYDGELSLGLFDIWVEVKPSGYHGRLIDCYQFNGGWYDRDGKLDSIFQGCVTHYMVAPKLPEEHQCQVK